MAKFRLLCVRLSYQYHPHLASSYFYRKMRLKLKVYTFSCGFSRNHDFSTVVEFVNQRCTFIYLCRSRNTISTLVIFQPTLVDFIGLNGCVVACVMAVWLKRPGEARRLSPSPMSTRCWSSRIGARTKSWSSGKQSMVVANEEHLEKAHRFHLRLYAHNNWNKITSYWNLIETYPG